MKSTELFKNTIKAYLDKRAVEDALFAASYAKESKTLNDCVTFILNQVKESGCNGFADDEIYSMAVHYYDEDDINVGESISGNVVVNHAVELTDEEKEQARKDAIKAYQEEEIRKIKEREAKRKAAPKAQVEDNQLSLF